MSGFPDRPSIEQTQQERLRAMLGAVAQGNRFYAQRLAGAGLNPASATLEDFSKRFPFTLKPEIVEDQRAHPPYGTNLTYLLEKYSRYNQTSATTGTPMRWIDTPEDWQWMLGNWREVYRAAGVGAGDRLFFAFSFGPFLGFWTAFEAAVASGWLCLPGGGLSSVARLRMMRDNAVTVLCCTPTYALRLAEVAAEEKLSGAGDKLKAVIVAGEPGGSIPSTRRRIEAAWPNARVVDHHGMTEVGPVSYECPQRPGVLHVIETSYLAEVVDPATGAPVGPGGAGELVLTTLGRIGSPLLRYRTGDGVRRAAGGVCSCGRSELALEGGILGRTDDMVLVRGVNVYPAAVEEVVRRMPEIAEYRVEVSGARGLAEMRVEIECAAEVAGAEAVARRLEDELRATFNLRVPVKAMPAGALPRFEMKAKRWIRGAKA